MAFGISVQTPIQTLQDFHRFHSIHVWYGIFTYIYHKINQMIGKHTIHGWYGIGMHGFDPRMGINDETKTRQNNEPPEGCRSVSPYSWVGELFFGRGNKKMSHWTCLQKRHFGRTISGWWFQLSTRLKNISQSGSFPLVRVKIKDIWNHDPNVREGKSRRHSYHALVYVSFLLLACLLATLPCTSTIFGTPIP